jgi:hypothetical protein
MIGGQICPPDPDHGYNKKLQTKAYCILPAGSGALKGVNAIQINGLISQGVQAISYLQCDPGFANVLNSALGYFECQPCSAGKFSTINEAFTCSSCLSGAFTETNSSCVLCSERVVGSTSLQDESVSVKDCVCAGKQYFSPNAGANGMCVDCVGLTGIDCDKNGMTLESLSLMPGFWRTSFESLDIRHCGNVEACIGTEAAESNRDLNVSFAYSRSEADFYCAEGYVGPYCSVCGDGYSGSFGSCRKCRNRNGGSIVVTLTCFFFGILLIFGIHRIITGFSKKTKKGLLIAGKLMISTAQICKSTQTPNQSQTKPTLLLTPPLPNLFALLALTSQ